MAATASPRPSNTFDLRNSAPYPIRLGRQLPSCSSVQYNHKPDLSKPDRAESVIRQSANGDRVTLSLKDGADEYKYSGTRRFGDEEYLLVLDEAGQEFVLEKLDSSYALNMTCAPWETSSRTLAERYAQIRPGGAEQEGDLFGNSDEEDGGVSLDPADADDTNPFDFRHYLDVQGSPSPPLQPLKPPPAITQSQSSTSTNTPLTKSVRKQPSAFARATKPPPKARTKVEPAEVPPTRTTSTRSVSPESRRHKAVEAEVPAVRLDRRASTRIAVPPKAAPKKREPDGLSLDDHDSGDLILEGDQPQRSSHHAKSSLGIALSNGFGDGPRSLRSAASSPADSHINSPAPRRPSPLGGAPVASHDDDDELVMDPDEEENEYDQAESDVDEDGDVDALKLPSPAQTHRPSVSGATVTGDDDDDLEKQMLLELEGGLDDYGAQGGGADSDEESEEE